jgi:diguanylate cyclase (GGDEF)-like protein/PAS domain S-box-containing protein
MSTDAAVVDRELPRALLADDDPLVGVALSAQLKGHFSIVGLANDADSAIALAREQHPDVALVDVEMPGGGLHATRGIHQGSPATAVVILTADEARSPVLQFLDAGAIAYLRKGIPAGQLDALLTEAIAAHRANVKRADRQRRAAEDRFRAAFDRGGVGMAIVALEGTRAGQVVEANEAFGRMLGREASALVGSNLEQWTHPGDLPDGLGDPLAALARGDVKRLEYEHRYLHRDGRVVDALVNAASFVDEDAQRAAVVQVLDISERKRFEGQLEYLADHDALSGLLNRRRFDQELRRELIRARRYASRGAILALDLDGFKFVNDSFGHAVGDELITSVAGTMNRALRESDIVARTGGDEFSIILPEADEQAAIVVGEKLLTAIHREATVLRGSRRAEVTASIGLSLFDGPDELLAEDILVEADIAMYDAKKAGKNRICVYNRDEHRRELIVSGQGWAQRLRHAVDAERFVLYAQPIVPVCSNGIPSFELLLRMPDDQGELMPPGAFLYHAERFDLIQSIDYWVMSQAVQLLHKYHSQARDISLAINVSAKTLNEGAIAEHLAGLLDKWPIPEGRLVLEVTETVAISSINKARDLALQLRRLGCRLALDDFGAGFATFYYLKHLEFDIVKIDGEFIKRLPESSTDQLVVRAVVDIARGLGIETIAEFVQDDETLALLRELGVGSAQGYHTGRPGSLDAILPPLEAAAASDREPPSPDAARQAVRTITGGPTAETVDTEQMNSVQRRLKAAG